MDINNPELSFEIVYKDLDIICIEVKTSNGRFAGTTSFYCNSSGDELEKLGKGLMGFPKNLQEEYFQEFGVANPKTEETKVVYSELVDAYSYVGLNFHCVDKLGHTAVHIVLIEEHRPNLKEARGKVTFELQFYPAALDNFIQEIMLMSKTLEGKAELIGNI